MSALTADMIMSPHAKSGASCRADVACVHCGLPVPPGLVNAQSEHQFCCHACDTAYHAICGSGLGQYYEYRRADASRAASRPATSTQGKYEEFDDPSFAALYCTPRADGLSSVTLVLEGLHCAACVWLLEKLPTVAPGVIDARVDFGRSQITIVHDPGAASLAAIARFMDRLGYASHALREQAARRAQLNQERAAIIRIALAGALFGNTMVIAFALYGAEKSGMEPGMRLFLQSVSAGLAALSVFGPGRVFFRGALASLRMRALHMDVPIALALTVGLVHGVVSTVRGTGGVYFDTLCTLVFLLLIGRWIQQRQQRRAADSIELLFSLAPSTATLVEDGCSRAVPIEGLKAGDIVSVKAGESVPVDGQVHSGASAVDASLLTGESTPVEVQPGDRVAAGSINLAAPLLVQTLETGRQTRIGQLMALVAEEARRKAPIVKLADKIAARFIVVVLALAALTFALWMPSGIEAAVEHTVALLIITCPCALGLATPLAIVSSLGRAARAGMLIKGGDALEALAGRGTLVLDKTGTLTTGRWQVREYHGPEGLKPLIAAAERGCSHPAARALAGAFDGPDAASLHATIHNSIGGGIVANVENVALTIGSPRFVAGVHAAMVVPESIVRGMESAVDRGLSVVLIAQEGAAVAFAALGDTVRPEALDCLNALRARGWSTVLLSGDHGRIARSIGAQLGFDECQIHGDASPQDKAEVVRALAAQGTTVMVGDGVNDAAALTAATVGVAVHGGAEAAMATADVYLSEPGLGGLVALLDRARQASAAIRTNLVASLLYNVVFGALAIAGVVSPLVAAVLMPLSSLTVIVLSFRDRRIPWARARAEASA